MKDMESQLETLLAQAAECASVAGRSADTKKRDLFDRLSQHYRVLAAEVQRAIDAAGET